MRPLPDPLLQLIIWEIAVETAIETEEVAYEVFARLLYRYLTDTQSPWEIDAMFSSREQSNESNP